MNSNWRLKMSLLVVVKADDKTAHDFQPGALEDFYRFDQVAAHVLQLVAFLQALEQKASRCRQKLS